MSAALLELKHPQLLLLLLVPALLLLLAWRSSRGRKPALALPTAAVLRGAPPSLRSRLGWLPFGLRLLTLAALTLAIARPRVAERFQERVTEGVDMMIAIDVSGSMRAEDFRPNNRLLVALDLVRRFVDSRHHDRLGLVIFAGKAYTQCPLTIDYRLLKQFIDAVGFGSVDEEGTAIGMAIGTALNRLRGSTAISRVVILVTDGINNRGNVDPLTAAEAARTLGIKIYTVGVGTRGLVPFPTESGYQQVEVPLDEEVLRTVADRTGGYYFRATDPRSFEEALQRIGELERSRIETTVQVSYDDRFVPLLLLALLLVGLELGLAATWLRRLP